MSDTDLGKFQLNDPPDPATLDADVVVSPDVHRARRIPPGQSRTRRWPVLDASGPPHIELPAWRLRVDGLVAESYELDWAGFEALPQARVFSDFHCVTHWSRLGNLWSGVLTRTLIERAGGAAAGARFVLVSGYDGGWTTNLPLDLFLAEDCLVATHHDGEPIALEHGGPARLIVPRLYAWKSAKWISGIRLLDHDQAGFWERNGYHMNGDPWREERFSA